MSKIILKLRKNKVLVVALAVFALALCSALIIIGIQGADRGAEGEMYVDDMSAYEAGQMMFEENHTNNPGSDISDADEEIYVDGIRYFYASNRTNFGISMDTPLAFNLRGMFDAVEYIVIGSFGAFESSFNGARNWPNQLEEDPNNYHRTFIYSFNIQTVLKGTIDSDTIGIAVPYLQRLRGEIRNDIFNAEGERVLAATEFDPWEIYSIWDSYIEPIPGEMVMLFLNYSGLFGLYRFGIQPYMIVLEEDRTVSLKSNFILPLEEREVMAVTHGESESGQPITFTRRSLLSTVIPDTISGMTIDALISTIESFEDVNPRRRVTIQEGGAGASASPASAQSGWQVTINAGLAPDGYTFAGWTSAQNIVLADVNAAETTFSMIDEPVTVTANWRAEAAVNYTMELELQVLSDHLIGYEQFIGTEHGLDSDHFLVHMDSWSEVTFMPVVYKVSSTGARTEASGEILWYESFTTEGFGDGFGIVSVRLADGSEMTKEFTYQIGSIAFDLGLSEPSGAEPLESAEVTEAASETTEQAESPESTD